MWNVGLINISNDRETDLRPFKLFSVFVIFTDSIYDMEQKKNENILGAMVNNKDMQYSQVLMV